MGVSQMQQLRPTFQPYEEQERSESLNLGFRELEDYMRQYEAVLDAHQDYYLSFIPNTFLVARLDGKNFTKLTSDCNFEKPFDINFSNVMRSTTKKLMQSGFRVIYAYTQSDEISLLFHPEEYAFSRKPRKYNSILASIASVNATRELDRVKHYQSNDHRDDQPAIFDCRVIPFTSIKTVTDYFNWRQLDATRNALNSYCYYVLRNDGLTPRQATAKLNRKNVSYKNDLLFNHGINFNSVPLWQRRGIGFYWETFSKEGLNPITNQTETAIRRRIKENASLPMKEDYASIITAIIKSNLT